MGSRSASRSEGEYHSSDSEAKAIRLPSQRREYDVDRHSRTSAQRRNSRSRSRSPYRAPRAEKRRRDEDSHRIRHDSRTFNVRYEDDRYHRYGTDSNHRNKRPRTYSPHRDRSRSPYRRIGDVKTTSHGRDNTRQSAGGDRKTDLGSKPQLHAKSSSQDFSNLPATSDTDENTSTGNARPVADIASNIMEETQVGNVMDEQALIEARRKRREAIKNKYKGSEPSLLVQALRVGSEAPATSTNGTPERSVSPNPTSEIMSTPGTPRSAISAPRSPVTPGFGNDDELGSGEGNSPDVANEASAADYDPTIDMQEERSRHDKRLFKEDERSMEQADQQVLQQLDANPFIEPKAELDMFAEDDDMFAESPTAKSNNIGLPIKGINAAMLDNSDDPEGYYMTILGELINNRYKVTQNLGRGMFASVIRATDSKTNNSVAIKIVRNNESMRKAGIKEIDILENIAANDPENKMHIVRFLGSFDHKGHLCMVFENLSMNLREVLKKYGRDVGISLKSIRAYSLQLLKGLSLLKKCQFLHADLKPDNILVNESRSSVKICDLGSASPITENATAPYLVSRFYRAPEVILGIPYDYGIDMWSIGCTLFELYTGKILFTGRNNNGMVRAIMECRGKFPNKLLRRGSLTFDYFDDLLNFKSTEPDKVTGKLVTRIIDVRAKPVRDLKSRLMPKGKRMDEQERKDVELFVDLLDKCLQLDPQKRITPSEALRHAFLNRGK